MSNIDFSSPTSIAIVAGFGTVAFCCIGASSFAVWKVLQEARREKAKKSKQAAQSHRRSMAIVKRQSIAARASIRMASEGLARDDSASGSDAEDAASQDSDVEANSAALNRAKMAQQHRGKKTNNKSSDDISAADPMALPGKKTHHYYLSYEKAHSRYKKTPERLAQELYDALLLQGFSGYKNYADTNKQSVASLKSSCTVIAMLHNEVFTDRCVMQWQVAKQERIPIVFILDRSRNFTNEMQEEMGDIDPEMLECKWIEYVDGGNAECVDQVVEWLKTAMRAPKANALAKRSSVAGKRSTVTGKKSNVSGFSVGAKKSAVLPGQPDDSGSSSSEEISVERCHVIDDEPERPNGRKTRLMKRIESRKKKKGSR